MTVTVSFIHLFLFHTLDSFTYFSERGTWSSEDLSDLTEVSERLNRNSITVLRVSWIKCPSFMWACSIVELSSLGVVYPCVGQEQG